MLISSFWSKQAVLSAVNDNPGNFGSGMRSSRDENHVDPRAQSLTQNISDLMRNSLLEDFWWWFSSHAKQRVIWDYYKQKFVWETDERREAGGDNKQVLGSSLGVFVKGKQAVDLWELLWWGRTKENLDEPPRSSGLWSSNEITREAEVSCHSLLIHF